MNTPISLTEWLSEKVETHGWAGVRESRSVAHTWRRATGGRVISAKLSASIEPSKEFVLNVASDDIESEYAAAAKNGVITTLLSRSHMPVLACTITLFELRSESGEDCYAAFYSVAAEATEQLLGTAPGYIHNIAW